MNRKGSVAIYGIMLSLVIIILALSLAPAGKQVIGDAMNSSTADFIGMDCNNESISNFTKASCIIVDFSLFYFFGGLIGIAGLVVTSKIVFS